jgi:hypothetical protein
MIFRYGNIWSVYFGGIWSVSNIDLLLITANSTITKDGRLVMGRGLAAQAKKLFPGIDRKAAEAVRGRRTYGFIKLRIPKLGLFQVKYDFWEKADLDLIRLSTAMLKEYAESDRHKAIHLPYPGIGNGRLSKEEVYPIIKVLPDNVYIWQFRKPTAFRLQARARTDRIGLEPP